MAGKDLGYAGPAQAASPPAFACRRPFWRGLVVLLLLAAVLTVVIKAFAVEAFRIPSGSMEDTLRVGDRVLVNKLVYRVRGIDRGDVIVFSGQGSWDPPPPRRPPGPVPAALRTVLQRAGMTSGGTDYVKRVIGLPGDRVSCCDARGRITVNGAPLNEQSYLYPGNQPSAQRFSVTVPPGRLWVMGDHRLNSSDSRYHGDDPGDGTIPERAVIGRVFLVVWPPAQFREVPIPATFARRGLAAPPRRGLTPLPMALGLAGMLPLAWACRRQTAHVSSDRR
ncbi:MAG: signal peptidase I [Trebonia sp.]